MASKKEIKEAILKVAGNPVSGPIASLADAMADAVVALDKKPEPKTKRVLDVPETRSVVEED